MVGRRIRRERLEQLAVCFPLRLICPRVFPYVVCASLPDPPPSHHHPTNRPIYHLARRSAQGAIESYCKCI